MTPLRDQLQAARREHHAASYPGDLASELLSPAVRPGRRSAMLRIAIGGALAAATVLAVLHRDSAPEPHEPAPQQLGLAAQPTPLLYQLPDRLPLTLPTPLVPASPPVSVSISALNSYGQQQYEHFGPILRQRLSWPGLLNPQPTPVDVVPGAATQQAVG